MEAVVGYSELGQIEEANKWESIAATKTTEDLVEMGRSAQEGSIKFYFLQCLIAHTVAKRRDGGLKLLAGEWGLAYTRASEMARVWREIVKPMVEKELYPPIELEHEYFHVALRAPEPMQAIIYAQDQKSRDSSFTCAKFKSALRTGLPENIKNCSKCNHFFFLDDVTFTISTPAKKNEFKGALMTCDVFGILKPVAHFNLQEKAAGCNIFTKRNHILGLTSNEPCSITNTSSEGSST